MPYISCFLMSDSPKCVVSILRPIRLWVKFVFFLSKRMFSLKPHFIMLILTLSLSSLIWSPMCYFQYMCNVSTACVCEAMAFSANEATVRLRTFSCSCKHWLSPNGGIDGIWYIWYSKLSKWISQPIVRRHFRCQDNNILDNIAYLL